MYMVAPRTGAIEISIAEEHLDYKPLTAAVYRREEDYAMVLLTRWRFTDEERAQIAAGEDFYLGVLTYGEPLQPLMPQIGPSGWEVPTTPEPESSATEDPDGEGPS